MMNSFQIYQRLLLIFIVIHLFDRVHCYQVVFACFDASRLKSIVESFIILDALQPGSKVRQFRPIYSEVLRQ